MLPGLSSLGLLGREDGGGERGQDGERTLSSPCPHSELGAEAMW